MDFDVTAEQKLFVESVTAFGQRYFADGAYAEEEPEGYPHKYLRLLANQGLTGICLPESHGGLGGSLMDAVLAIEAMAQVAPRAADMIQATNFGAIQQIAAYGTEAIQARFLPALLTGERLVSVGMSEPNAGSATTEIATTATYTDDGVVIRGGKTFNTNGSHADLWVVWVRFGPGTRGIGCVIVERGTPGLDVNATSRFISGEPYAMLSFDDCVIPKDYVMLDHDGFKKLFTVFNIERLGNAARSLAYGEKALSLSVDYLKERRQFGQRLADFQGLRWKIADMKVQLESAKMLLYRAAADADKNGGVPNPAYCSLAKLACNEAGFFAANEALQMFGGYGYTAEGPIQYMFRRTRGWMIAGGTVEIQRNQIATHLLGKPERPGKETGR
ncbi:acyl-CoA/acyl-ACP dehydrogenase [Alicyclobacillus cycloheptanicus]|uniref:Alkylation response protein AidB-like acyl-CoA dehydrogenase n=1 Tax=Alicyclobacillus cycloheptanicus TaxID=1457 RepID=A0ABT9XN57_9BACL|nr:acyl-CoA dehydrogenase family protein [Alicyclobacillus cycloheptanicus]MDQ0191464.1 alkylation response protein AidB-like acyl-CoA dehydrogenase [Alicyclobacillus cycloheptanicus]WDM00160.1 acyl-CoA/acyl-ACP dehydrogenase [Alicyclobacillus cycloheptanicus]